MAGKHSTSNGSAVHAVAYLRVSREDDLKNGNADSQSIDQQREAIARYATSNGLKLVAEYLDDGVSGDRTEERRDFQRMRNDAAKGKFSVVVCWDQDRFGRFDILDAGKWIAPFRDAGVRLETVAQGKIDWNDLVGQLIYSVNQLAKAQYLRDLSRNVTRGIIASAKAGKLNGHMFYGYNRILVDEHGKHRQHVTRGEQAMRPKNWSSVLVVNEDEATTVRWLFTTFANTDTSLRRLAHDLNARGSRGPTGGAWHASTIRKLLANEGYVGRFTFGKRRAGKYHHARVDDVKARSRGEIANGKPSVVVNPREAWIIEDDAHQAIIDQHTFDLVQAKLDVRKRSGNPGYRTHTRQNSDVFFLSGLVYCERCGARMYGERENQKPKYLCSTYHRCGRQNPTGCRCHTVRQDVLLGVITRKLQASLMLDGNRTRLEAELRASLSSQAKPNAANAVRLRKLVAKLDQQIATAADRLLTAPDDLVDVLAPRLRELKSERERAALELSTAERTSKPRDIEATVKALVDKLWSLATELTSGAEPDRLREVLRLFVERVDLHFRHEGDKRSELDSGSITLRSDAPNFRCVNHTSAWSSSGLFGR